jgi:hypothetical protein
VTRRRKILAVVGLVGAMGVLYTCVPRRAHLASFDPNAIARLETGMWRDYYEHKKLALALGLYSLFRDEYRFSPLDGLRLARSAAQAAIVFKDSTNDDEADRALPELRAYFQVMRDRGDKTFDVGEAARLELAWWKARRHQKTPREYGKDVASAAAIVYGVPPERLEAYGQLRAEAMDYRDRRDDRMTAEDWDHVQRVLERAFGELAKAVGP